ncbi:TAFII55 protein conserved region-domain-containing protein [Globomyces pollinis-pini]|nr:TAFII55 protein conserved region-domain-containing protein [Globomyces pollinis-pini]
MVVIKIKQPVEPKDGKDNKGAFKLSSKSAAQTGPPKIKVKQFYDKDIDEALQEAPIEEHFILRLPPSLYHLREKIKKRDVPVDLNMVFKDPRYGKLSLGKKSYHATLVDLPCITESLKTIDNKQFYKIADVSQMVIVHEEGKRYTGPKDCVFNDGLSIPLKDVRNCRFRKRMSKKVVEDVEAEVERLLLADIEAEELKYEVHERKDADMEEDMEEDEGLDSDGEEGDDFGIDLDAAIDEVLDKDDGTNTQEQEQEQEESEEEESGDESDDGEQSDNNAENENENDENNILKNSLKNEITQLENKLNEKNALANNQVNAIMKSRFKGIVDKLAAELALKREQLSKLEEEILKEDDGNEDEDE